MATMAGMRNTTIAETKSYATYVGLDEKPSCCQSRFATIKSVL